MSAVMSAVRPAARVVAVAALAAFAGVASAAAQEPARPDSAAADSAARARRGAGVVMPDSAAGGEASEVPRDSIVRALLELEGFSTMEYTSDAARYTAEAGRVELIGNARVQRAAETMTADSLLTFDQDTEIVCGYGSPVLSGGPGEPVESDQVCYNVGRRLGVAVGARTTFNQQATWYLHGDSTYLSGASRVYGRHTNFTSCDLETPHYHFSAGSVKIVRDSVMVARNITLRFGDVPVFWVPFMMQSMKRGRRSGLLRPNFGVNDIAHTSSGYERHVSNVGYYWAINDYMGAEVALDWFSGNWTALTADFDYNWRRQFLSGGVALSRYWRESGNTELTLHSRHRWDPTERTSADISVNYASSSRFIERNTFDPRELNRSIDSDAGLRHRFDWGHVSLSASRRQLLHNNEVRTTLPEFALTAQSITLSQPLAPDGPWWKDITWTGGSLNFREDHVDVDESYPDVTRTDRVQRDASARTGFRVGNLSWSQNVSLRQAIRSATVAEALGPLAPLPAGAASPSYAAVGDPLAEGPGGPPADPDLLRDSETELTWSGNLGYTQQLIGSTTLTPSISLGGQLLRDDRTRGEFVAGPTRFDLGASLRTTIYGFWPGIGPFSRIRHKLSPSVRYSYSPAPAPLTPRQREIFGVVEGRVRNRLTIGVNQTFEAKYEADADSAAAAPAEGVAPEAMDADTATAAGGPQRLPQSEKAMLLSLTTNAVTYDFVRWDETGRPLDGFVTTSLNHSLRSDLLPDLNLSVSHDVFGEDEDGEGRTLDFHLTRVEARFQLSADSWIARVLGLDRTGDEAEADSASAPPDSASAQDLSGPGALMPGQGPPGRAQPAGGSTGRGWRASLSYSLQRPRAAVGGSAEASQMLRGNLMFEPTRHWSVRWSTSYSFTDHEFSDQILTLTRDLHRWRANFDFVKARNGNFSFQFRVTLLDNRDIEFDYEQRGGGAGTGRTIGGPR